MRNILKILVPFFSFALVMAVVHLHAVHEVDTQRSEMLSQVDVVCSVKAKDLAQTAGRVLLAAEMIGSWSRMSAVNAVSFKVAGQNTLRAFPEVEGVALAPDGVLSYLHPLANYEQAYGKKLLNDPERRFASRESLRTHKGVLLGPVLVESGAHVFIGQVPLYEEEDNDDSFWGFSTAISKVDTVLEHAGFPGLREKGFLYKIEKPGVASDQTMLVAGLDAPLRDGVTKNIQVSGLHLMLTMAFERPMPVLGDYAAGYAGGTLFALVFATLTGLLMTRPGRFRELAQSRTQRLLDMSANLVRAITRSRALQSELESAREMQRGMFEHSPAVKLIIDPMELSIVNANPAAERFLGKSGDELKGVPLDSFMRGDENELGRKMALGMRGQAEPMLARVELPGAEHRDVEITAGPVKIGGKVRLLAVLQDVTGREAALEELLASRIRLESIFEALDCAIVEVDAEGFIRFANPGFTQMFGHEREGAVGMPFLVVCPQDASGPCEDLHARMMEGRLEKVCTRKRFVRRDGREFWGSACVSPLRSPNGEIRGCVAAITDVTDIIGAKREAEGANRAKNRFLANVSHEIRSPMNAIMGLAELALRSNLDSRQRGNMEKILEAGRALIKVMDGILDYSSLESGRLTLAKTPFDPMDVLESIGRRFADKAGAKGLGFSVDMSGELSGVLLGDPVRLEQVLANLMSNALKFTEKGRVRLEAVVESVSGASVPIRFSVSDTGRGMDPGRLSELEQPFVQGENGMDRTAKGAGLGLSIAGKLLALMGTRLKAESKPGEGTTMSFTASFPTAAMRGNETVPGGMEELSAGLAGKKVLVVDDNPMGLHTAVEMLKLGRIVSGEARSGKEALAKLEDGEYDAVLLDIQMPGMDGFETFKRIRATRGGESVPVIAVTGHAREEDRVLCFEAGMDNHLSKPYSPESLFGALRQYLTRDRLAAKDAAVLDTAGALTLLMGNKELYQRLLTGFVREYSLSASDMRRLVGAGDASGAAALAHTLKGLASNLGGERLKQVCLQLESAFTKDNPYCPPELLESLESELGAFVQEASRVRLEDDTES